MVDLKNIRGAICQMAKHLYDKNIADSSGGNISVRNNDKEDSQPEYHIIKDDSYGGLNRSWARLIQKIYEVDPLICSCCIDASNIDAYKAIMEQTDATYGES